MLGLCRLPPRAVSIKNVPYHATCLMKNNFTNFVSFPCVVVAMLALLQEQFVQQYGRIYRIWLGFQTFVDISSPQLLEVTNILCLYEKRVELKWIFKPLYLLFNRKY